MEKRVRTARTLLVSTGAMLVGMLFAAGSAHAALPVVTSVTFDGEGDTYLNAFEIGAVEVHVAYPADLDYIEVRVVQSATCSPAGTPTTGYQTIPAPNPLGDTETLVFDLSDATMQPTPFAEGGVLCAQARAYLTDAGQQVGGPWKGSNTLIKDTIVLAGTVNIIDPVSPGYLNIAEIANDPVGDPAESVKGAWKANPDSDAINATVWWDEAVPPADLVTDPACGPFGFYDESSVSHGGLTADQTLAKACADPAFGIFADDDEISFNAQWRDLAGNVSGIATTELFPNGNLLIDVTKPLAPVVDLLGATTAWLPPLGNAATSTCPAGAPLCEYVTEDVINSNNQHAVDVEVEYFDDDIDFIDVNVTDGSVSIDQRREPIDNPQLFPGFDLSGMKNCDAGIENPPLTYAPISPLDPAQTIRAADCITASATLTDLAGNESDPAADNGYKDAVVPPAPTFAWVPTNITDANDQLTRVEVIGEGYANAFVRLTDEDPSSNDLANFDIDRADPFPDIPASLTAFRLYETATNLEGFGAIFADVTTLADGTLTATVHLSDPYGNVSESVQTFATKDLTTPSLRLTSPGVDSMNQSTVTFTGVAEYDGVACDDCTITIYDHPSNIRNYGNPANIPLVTTDTDANGFFEATYTYTRSGIRRAYFRATADGVGTGPGQFPDLDGDTIPDINGRPSAVRRFKVDAVIPTVQFTSPNERVHLPGDPVVVTGTAGDDFSGLVGVELVVTRLDPGALLTSITQGRPPALVSHVMTVPGNQSNCSSCGPEKLSATWSYDFSSLPPGRYTVQARSVDYARYTSHLSSNYNFTKLG